MHLLPSGEHAGFSRDRRGIARLVAWLASQARLLVVVEATGWLGADAGGGAEQAGIAVAVVNPRQMRDFARAAGLLAKTDRLDAYALALFGERLWPAPRRATRRGRPGAGRAGPAPAPARAADRGRAQPRPATEEPLVLASIEAHLGWLSGARRA